MADINWGTLSVLIVDDERYMRGIAHRVLTDIGIRTIHEAEDGAAALKVLTQDSVHLDIVLLDLDMPVLDGFQVLEIMRKDKRLIDIPTVIMSGHSDMKNVIRAADIGIHGFAVKPVSLAVLKKQLARGLTSPPIDPAIFKK